MLYHSYDADNINSDEHKIKLERITNRWLMRSNVTKELILKLNIPLLSHENFCQNPSYILNLLSLPKGVADTIIPNTELKVKDYENKQLLINMTVRYHT